MNRQVPMYTRKDYSIIALAESLKRGGDQRKARFERSLSGMTLELLPTADRFYGAAIPSVSFARDLEVGSQAGGHVIGSYIMITQFIFIANSLELQLRRGRRWANSW